jgi:hypothetical protein
VTDDEIIVRKTVIGGKRWRDDYTVICVHATTRHSVQQLWPVHRAPVMSLTCCLGRAARLAMSRLMDGLISASDAQPRDLAIMSVVGTFRNISKRLVIELPRCLSHRRGEPEQDDRPSDINPASLKPDS